MKITKRLLQSKGACASQVALFAETFPHGAEITEAVCLSVADKFDWDWAAQNLLSPEFDAEYARVRAQADAEYARVRAPAYAEYQRVRAPAYAEYKRVRAQADAEYQRVCAQADAEYARVRAPAYAEHQRVRAATFGRLAASE
jgi:hypothetical protein